MATAFLIWQVELQELEQKELEKRGKGTLTKVGVIIGAFGVVKVTRGGMRAVEGWMRQQELNDIAEERELTGTYISVDAGDVDTVIDPTTGKNITLAKPKRCGPLKPQLYS